VAVQAQAAITSTHGHPRMIWPVRPKFNIIILRDARWSYIEIIMGRVLYIEIINI